MEIQNRSGIQYSKCKAEANICFITNKNLETDNSLVTNTKIETPKFGHLMSCIRDISSI